MKYEIYSSDGRDDTIKMTEEIFRDKNLLKAEVELSDEVDGVWKTDIVLSFTKDKTRYPFLTRSSAYEYLRVEL